MNKLIEVYNNYSKKPEINRFYEVCFKINFFENNEKIDNNTYQDYLSEMTRYDFTVFFNQMNIVIENYAYDFLINADSEYFIKFKLYYPSIKSLLEYTNSLCIIDDCNEQILDYSNFVCPKHLTQETLDNFDAINKSFYKRTADLDSLYENYKNQTDLITYLNKIVDQEKGYFVIKSYEIKKCECRLEITQNTDNLIEIDLEKEISILDCLILDESDNSDNSDNLSESNEEIINFLKHQNLEEIDDDDEEGVDYFESDYDEDEKVDEEEVKVDVDEEKVDEEEVKVDVEEEKVKVEEEKVKVEEEVKTDVVEEEVKELKVDVEEEVNDDYDERSYYAEDTQENIMNNL